jgi:hypothetical protein
VAGLLMVHHLAEIALVDGLAAFGAAVEIAVLGLRLVAGDELADDLPGLNISYRRLLWTKTQRRQPCRRSGGNRARRPERLSPSLAALPYHA